MTSDSPLVVDVSDIQPTVVSYTIPSIDDPKCTNVRTFKLPSMDNIKKAVADAKGLYDGPCKDDEKQFYYITRQFEHANTFRQEVHDRFKTPNVSNAWLKAYELFIHYKSFPPKADKFVYFDNAAFPGSWILAAWHIVHTMCDIKDFQWYGSSLLTDDELKGGRGPLEDKYKLYENYPANWLMNENNNGDVTSWDNQKNFANRLGGTVDLYTSDLGFDVSEDYNKQEELHAHANLGQIITGLLVLKKGGTMITKQYSYFEPFTISLMGVMTRLFDKVEICKPMFSKSGNSETYLVCIGYNGYDGDFGKEGVTVQRLLLERLKNWCLKPLVTKNCLGNGFLNAIKNSQTYFANIQIKKLNNIISEHARYVKSKNTDRKHISNTNMFKDENLRELNNWKRVNTLKILPYDKNLKVKEVISWKKNKSKNKFKKYRGKK